EVMRVLRPGGSLIVVDNDYRWGEVADLLAAAASVRPMHTASAIDSWWRERGATRHEVRSRWHFASRAALAAVLNIEVPASVARAAPRFHGAELRARRVRRHPRQRCTPGAVEAPGSPYGMLHYHVPLVSALWAGSGWSRRRSALTDGLPSRASKAEAKASAFRR